MKPSFEWNEEDILSLIKEGEKESLTMDYKACGALIRDSENKKTELSKDVSAFANSAGGTIVYGVVENGLVPQDIDVGYDPNEITKEWLEQVINSRIYRKIDGLIINQVELIKTRPNKVLYVVHIPQSMRAPHMAYDKRFYKRYNFQSVTMEEYEVRDIANRSQGPDLSVEISSNDTKLSYNESSTHSSAFIIDANVINESPVPAEYYIVKLFIDSRIKFLGGDFSLNGNQTLVIDGKPILMNKCSKNYAIPYSMPLWEGVHFKLGSLEIAFPKEAGKFFLVWEILSPRMSARKSLAYLISDSKTATLYSHKGK